MIRQPQPDIDTTFDACIKRTQIADVAANRTRIYNLTVNHNSIIITHIFGFEKKTKRS